MDSLKKRKKISFKDLFANFGLGKEKDYFADNLSMLLGAGMTVILSLSAIEGELRSKKMKEVIARIKEEVENGSPLWSALESTMIFPTHVISLVRIGEETGNLTENLKVVATQEEKDRVFRSKIRSAMLYPVFILSLTLAIGLGIAWFILPKLATVFNQLKMPLPFITKILIGLGNFLGNYGFIVLPLFVLLVISAIYFIFYFPRTKFLGQMFLFSFPGIKELIQETEISHFCYLLGTLLEAGLPVLKAIDSLKRATIFPYYKRFCEYLYESIEEGNSFQKSFSLYPKLRKLIPLPVQQMIVAGEKSGKLSETLIKLGQNFEDKTEITTKNLAVVLEPVLLLIVWAGVVFVALAIILPIYSLIGGLNNDQKMDVTSPSKNVIPPPVIHLEKKLQLEIIKGDFKTLNVREEPSLKGKIITKVKGGEKYEYLKEESGWYQIILSPNQKGWVLGQYVKKL